MRKLIINKNFVLKVALTIILILFFPFFISSINSIIGYFIFAIFCIYFMVIPSNLYNPKNFVMAFYFMWYGVAPLFASRYASLVDGDNNVILAYGMFLITFSCAMLTLDFVENREALQTEVYKKKRRLESIELVNLIMVYVLALFFYIQRTGGVSLWISNANDAFFSRRGSGFLYLLFEYAALLIFFFEGKKRGIFRKVVLIGVCGITMYFCGSKSTMMLFLFMLFSTQIMNIKLFDIKSILVIVVGVMVFFFGMYIRAGQYMNSIESSISVSLGYFDTLDEFLLLLRNHSSGLIQTLYYPINWLLMKFGIHIGLPYYDTSIWLTTLYYPESWAGGGTHQWPLEAYLYLNFKYWLGIPLVIAYFYIMGLVYKKGKIESGIWRFIFINECLTIGSHLRGGLFNYWYIYLLPFYIILLFWEKRLKILPK